MFDVYGRQHGGEILSDALLERLIEAAREVVGDRAEEVVRAQHLAWVGIAVDEPRWGRRDPRSRHVVIRCETRQEAESLADVGELVERDWRPVDGSVGAA